MMLILVAGRSSIRICDATAVRRAAAFDRAAFVSLWRLGLPIGATIAAEVGISAARARRWG